MESRRRAHWLAWAALAFLALAVPMFFVPGGGESYGDHTWAIAGAVVLHPAIFAGLGAWFTYRRLPDEEQDGIHMAQVALPLVILGAGLLWLFWT